MPGKNRLSIEIESDNIRMAYGRYAGQKIAVNGYSILKTPEGAAENGNLLLPEELCKIIYEEIKRKHYRTNGINFVISSMSIITRVVQIPKSNPREVELILKNEAQQFFPVDLKEYVYDYRILEDVAVREGINTRILLIALPIKLADEYMQLGEMLGVKVRALDVKPNCICKLTAVNEKEQMLDIRKHAENSSYIILDIEASSINATIFSGSVLKETRLFKSGKDEETNNPLMPAGKFIEFYLSVNTAERMEGVYLAGERSRLKDISENAEQLLGTTANVIKAGRGMLLKKNKERESFDRDFPVLISVLGALK